MTTTTNQGSALTEMEKVILTFLLNRPGLTMNDLIQRGVEKHRTDKYIIQAIDSLLRKDLLWMRVNGIIGLSEKGEKMAEASRYDNRWGGGCPDCVRVFCVCELRVVCLGDGPHSLGCHGSHE